MRFFPPTKKKLVKQLGAHTMSPIRGARNVIVYTERDIAKLLNVTPNNLRQMIYRNELDLYSLESIISCYNKRTAKKKINPSI